MIHYELYAKITKKSASGSDTKEITKFFALHICACAASCVINDNDDKRKSKEKNASHQHEITEATASTRFMLVVTSQPCNPVK